MVVVKQCDKCWFYWTEGMHEVCHEPDASKLIKDNEYECPWFTPVNESVTKDFDDDYVREYADEEWY